MLIPASRLQCLGFVLACTLLDHGLMLAAILLNLMLLILLRATPTARIRLYRTVLTITCVCDLFLAISTLLAQPVRMTELDAGTDLISGCHRLEGLRYIRIDELFRTLFSAFDASRPPDVGNIGVHFLPEPSRSVYSPLRCNLQVNVKRFHSTS